MAHFILTYGYNDTPLRAERREDHLAHLNKLNQEGSVLLAGPVADGSGMIVFQAEDQAAAEALVAQDPYTQADVTRDRQLREWTVSVGSTGE
ncbi:MAG: YciI family protein [Nocardioidaceae bacterium]